jgi:integrase
VQIGAAHWPHVPLGKLRTDRYIPLHPQLKELLDDWLARRPASLRSPYLFVEHGHRIGSRRLERAVDKAGPSSRDWSRQPTPLAPHARHTGDQPRHEP